MAVSTITIINATRGHVKSTNEVRQPVPDPVVEKYPEWVGLSVVVVLIVGLISLGFMIALDKRQGDSND